MEYEIFLRVVLLEHLEYPLAEFHHVKYREYEQILVVILQMAQFERTVYHVVETHRIVIDRFEALFAFRVFGLLLEQAHRTDNH